MNDQSLRQLVEYRLQQARETLKEAEGLYGMAFGEQLTDPILWIFWSPYFANLASNCQVVNSDVFGFNLGMIYSQSVAWLPQIKAELMNNLPNSCQIPVRLGHLRHLYEAPDFDPFTPSLDYLSGVERIFREIRRAKPKGPIGVTIYLPVNKVASVSEQDCVAAIRRICDVRIEQIDDELASMYWEGTRTVLVGLLVWGVCLFLSLFIGGAKILSEFPRQYLSEGLIVVGWVALWYPSETILYVWWGHNRDKKVYKRMKDCTIRIACLDKP